MVKGTLRALFHTKKIARNPMLEKKVHKQAKLNLVI